MTMAACRKEAMRSGMEFSVTSAAFALSLTASLFSLPSEHRKGRFHGTVGGQ